MGDDLARRREQLDVLLRTLDEELGSSSGLADTMVALVVSGEHGGTWVVVTQGGSGCVRGMSEMETQARQQEVQCTVKTDMKTISQLADGKLKPAMALLRGKISYSGNYTVFRNLQRPLRAAMGRAVAEIGPQGLGDHLVSLTKSKSGASEEWAEGLTFILDESHPEWVKDAQASRCQVCLTRFGFLFRRHHCRLCGKVVCATCSGHHVKGNRVCTLCFQSRVADKGGSRSEDSAPARARAEGCEEAKAGKKTMLPFERLVEHVQRLQDKPIAAAIEAKAMPLLGITRKLLLRLRGAEAALAALRAEGALTAAGLRLVPLTALSCLLTLSWGVVLSGVATWEPVRPVRAVLSLGAILLFAHRVGCQAVGLGAALASAAATRGVDALPAAGLASGAASQFLSTVASARPVLLVVAVVGALVAHAASRAFGRLLRIYSTAGFIILSYFSVQVVCKRILRMSDSATTRVFEAMDRLMAPYACEQILALRSVFVKFGQYIGSRADIIPPHWGSVLAKLQDDMPADSPAYVERCIEHEFGAPVNDLFERFDFVPMASASVAQVHRGVLRAGACPLAGPGQEGQRLEAELEVAVKVQHEGIEAIMRSDIVAFERIVRFIAWLNPRFDVAKALLRAWETEMLKELDFNVEAGNLKRVRANLRRAGMVADSDFDYVDAGCAGSQVLVPKPIHALVARRAFCMTFVHGFKVTDVEQLDLFGVDRCALVKRVVHAYANQLYVDGFFNADPHAGNLMVSISDDGTARPVLLDFGMAVTLPQEQRVGYCKLVHAISGLSVSGLTEAIAMVGYENSQSAEHPERDLEFFSFLLRDTGDRKSQRKATATFRKRRKEQRKADLEDDPDKQGRFFSNFPDSLIFLFRVLGLIRGLCTTLDAPISYLDIMGDYARLGLVHHHLVCAADASGTTQAVVLHRPKTSTLPRSLGARALTLQSKLQRVLRQYAQQAEAPLDAEEGFVVDDFLGAQVCVISHGHVVADCHEGVLDELGPAKVTDSTLFPLMDLTRLLPTLVLLRLAESGQCSLDDPVSQYWPGFYHKTASIADVLSHAAFLTDVVPPTTSAAGLASAPDFTKVQADQPQDKDNERSRYTVFTNGYCLAGLVVAISKAKSIEPVLNAQLIDPLNLSLELFLSAKDAREDRLATVANGFAKFVRGIVMGGQVPAFLAAGAASSSSMANATPAAPAAAPQNKAAGGVTLPSGVMLDPCCVNSKAVRSAVVPSFGGFGTARGLATALQRVLFERVSKVFLRDMSEAVLREESTPLFGTWRWSYGMQVYDLEGVRVLCHHGFGGQLAIVVPEKQLVLTVLVNCLTLDRACTKQVVELVLNELDVAASAAPLFEGMF